MTKRLSFATGTAFTFLIVLSACSLSLGPKSKSPSFTPEAGTNTTQNGDLSKDFDVGKTPLQTIHISPDGNDSTGDGSASSPFASLSRAAQNLPPGTSIVLHSGSYSMSSYIFLSEINGTANAPIWIGGVSGEPRPVLTGTALQISKLRYVVIHDLEISGSSGSGLNVDDGGDYANEEASRYVIFRNLFIHDTGLNPSGVPNCLKISGLNDFVIEKSELARCGNGNLGTEGIDMVGCHRGVVAGVYFHETGFGGIQTKGGSENTPTRGNRFLNSGSRAVNMGGSTSDAYFRPPLSTTNANYEAKGIVVQSNIFQGATTAAAFTGCFSCSFEQNTIIDPTGWFLRILQEHSDEGGYTFIPTRDGTIVNNIFYFSRALMNSYEDINVSSGVQQNTFILSHNLWFAHDQPSASAPNLPNLNGSQVTSSIIGDDPLFRNSSSADFHLDQKSPAIAAGLNPELPLTDYSGVLYRSPPTLGAFESP